MPVPDELLIAGAIVGLAGGLAGAASGVDNLVQRVRKARTAKRDSRMLLTLEMGEFLRHDGPEDAKFPVAEGTLWNHGKVAAKDVEVTASTGWAEAFFAVEDRRIAVKILPPDARMHVLFAMVPVHLADKKWRSSERPFRVGRVELSVTWRIDGSSERSKPLRFSRDYSSDGFS